MGYLKKDAPKEVVEAIQRIEDRADECFRPLGLFTYPADLIIWALLVGGIRMVEREIMHRGDNTPDLSATLQNVSRFVPVAIKWALNHGRPPAAPTERRWTRELAAKTEETLGVAHEYSTFESCFPMWHRNRNLAELVAPTLVRFTAPGTARNRQVSAYQKGARPKEGSFKAVRAEKAGRLPTAGAADQRRKAKHMPRGPTSPIRSIHQMCGRPFQVPFEAFMDLTQF